MIFCCISILLLKEIYKDNAVFTFSPDRLRVRSGVLRGAVSVLCQFQ